MVLIGDRSQNGLLEGEFAEMYPEKRPRPQLVNLEIETEMQQNQTKQPALNQHFRMPFRTAVGEIYNLVVPGVVHDQ